MKYTFDTNAYVEQSDKYGSDRVEINLNEGTKVVTMYLIDVYGVAIASAPKLIDETFTTLPAAIEYYEDAIHQLSQGDVVRAFNRKEKNIRSGYASDNSRYSSF